MNEIVLKAKQLQPQLIHWRRYVHHLAETGMDTHNTSAFVKEKLEEMGYHARYIAGTGVTAIAGGKKPGKCFLLRADMDAIGGLTEDNELDYRAINGNAHACGHDFHTAMLLGAARVLKSYEDEIDGCIKFMFQPAEESLEGAKAMIDDGILETPHVDAAAMIHMIVGDFPYISSPPAGTIVIPDKGFSSLDFFEITIKGKPGFGALPQNKVDPLYVASHLHLALMSITSREISALETAAVTVGTIEGTAGNNATPETAVIKGAIYAMTPKTRSFIWERIEEISTNIAAAFRATVVVQMTEGAAPMINDPFTRDLIKNALMKVFGPEEIESYQSLGGIELDSSEDFSFIAEKVPSVMLFLSAGGRDEGYVYPLHQSKTIFNEDVLSKGAAIYAISALSWLKENQ